MRLIVIGSTRTLTSYGGDPLALTAPINAANNHRFLSFLRRTPPRTTTFTSNGDYKGRKVVRFDVVVNLVIFSARII
nr:hypothetical protein [Tanacetum cinerariifolium]